SVHWTSFCGARGGGGPRRAADTHVSARYARSNVGKWPERGYLRGRAAETGRALPGGGKGAGRCGAAARRKRTRAGEGRRNGVGRREGAGEGGGGGPSQRNGTRHPLHRGDLALLAHLRKLLVAELLEGAAQLHARLRRHDHRIDVPALGGDVRAGHVLVVEVHEHLLHRRLLLLRHLGELAALDHHHRGLGAHHRDLRRRPREIQVAAEILRAHHRV